MRECVYAPDHKGAVMHAPLGLQGRGVIKQIHQQRLAAPDLAPEVKPCVEVSAGADLPSSLRKNLVSRGSHPVAPYGGQVVNGLFLRCIGISLPLSSSSRYADIIGLSGTLRFYPLWRKPRLHRRFLSR